MERLDGSVRVALRRAGVPDAGVLAEVTHAWPDAVGAAIARAAWPQRLARDGTLHVTTISSTWAFELGRMEAEVRAKLAVSLGDATPPSLRFAPGPVPSPPAEESPVSEPLAPTAEEASTATELSAEIEDPALREAVRKAVAAGLARGRGDRQV
ncbi:DciA family protein [Gaiella sp.]|jgi:hypothetical protein|uniref:DciA family protein n=1 Tax=Gaiella sp. TaxID=2663207 RepID=UPI002E301AAA|nr:DciA family protein [Gaiella sp.]HEX5583338.1 DciA family protein [Gaiella sp.]